MQVLAQEHDEFMDYNKNVDMHVEIHEEQPQNAMVQTCMHEFTLKFNSLNQFLNLNTNLP